MSFKQVSAGPLARALPDPVIFQIWMEVFEEMSPDSYEANKGKALGLMSKEIVPSRKIRIEFCRIAIDHPHYSSISEIVDATGFATTTTNRDVRTIRDVTRRARDKQLKDLERQNGKP